MLLKALQSYLWLTLILTTNMYQANSRGHFFSNYFLVFSGIDLWEGMLNLEVNITYGQCRCESGGAAPTRGTSPVNSLNECPEGYFPSALWLNFLGKP